MINSILLLLLHFSGLGSFRQLPVERNPVPIPGTALEQMSTTRIDHHRIYDFPGFTLTGRQGEGCCDPTVTAGADRWIYAFCQDSAKGGQPPQMSNSSNRPMLPQTAVHKRSYKRACRRALTYGNSHYHGRCMQVHDFPQALVQKIQQDMQPHGRRSLPNRPLRAKDRISCLHWNPGGLSQAVFLEVKQWLLQQPVDVVVITETRWSFSSNWADKNWLYAHTASQEPRSGGILAMISRRIAEPEQLGYAAIADGRLLQIRLHYDQRAFDILAIYQHVDQRSSTSMQYRDKIWTALNDTLHNIPSRNNLLCAGDFNCALSAQPPWVGTTTFKWNGRQCTGSTHQDQGRLQEILRAHGLTALDTWGASGPTFIHGHTVSRIDHFLTRIYSSDGYSKQVQFLPFADFVPDNSTHHIPIACTIRAKHMSYQRFDKPTSCTYAQRNQCRQAGLQETRTWHCLRQQVIEALHEHHQATTPDELIQQVHSRVSTAFHQFFDGKNPNFPQVDHSLVSQTIETKWHHKQQLRILANNFPSLKCILQAWFHRSRYQHLQRKQQRDARQAKRTQFIALCEEVTVAAQVHDTHSMFGITNRYSPKKPLARARLRSPDGTIADQYVAHSMTVSFVQQMWQGPAQLPLYWAEAPGVPFAIEDVIAAVTALHTNKSVAQPFLPGVVWRSAPYEVAYFIFQQLNHWWRQTPPIIPQSWRDSWIYFLPKPGKPNTHPEQMRPISLMEPLGKLVMGLLTKEIKNHILISLCRYPQFGFLPLRAATDAIMRVATHSKSIRELVGAHRRTVRNQIADPVGTVICGGLSLFLDLNRAFDCADRTAILDHLIALGTPPNLVQLVACWHENTNYNLVFRGETTSIPVGRGLRQGCKIAPLLWVCYMDLFMSRLAIKTGRQWIQDNLTIYADDVHIGCRFMSASALKEHLINIGHALDVIESMKLSLSYSKSYMMIAYAGTNPRPALKGVLHKTPDGTHIRIPRADGQLTTLPLRNKASYLGVTLSYHAYEHLAWTHRKHAGWTAFSRLRPWLRNRQIPQSKRLYLWKTCVYTVMTYGILASNVTLKVLHEYQVVVYRMIRIILGDHAFLTHRTHQQVFQHFHLDHPLDVLQALAMGLLQRIQRRTPLLQSDDFLHRVHWSHLPEAIQLIHMIRANAPEVPVNADASEPVRLQARQHCPFCSFHTTSIANMRRHMTAQHDAPYHRVSHVSPLSMALNGKPQCMQCHHLFSSWIFFCSCATGLLSGPARSND